MFLSSHLRFHGLDPRQDQAILLCRSLGQNGHFSAKNLFYAQAGAACHFLFSAENGKYRSALLEILGAYYRGESKASDISGKLGWSPDELGEAIEAYARKRIESR